MVPVLRGDLAEFDRIAPAGFRILSALDQATTILGLDLTITCGTEDHPPDDPHSTGEAYDVRVRTLNTDQILKLVTTLASLLGTDYFTVLLETPVAFTDLTLTPIQYINPGATAPHIHIQRRKHTLYPPIPAPGLHA